ncbi:NADAR family protein [Psychromonas sp. PT13]|uniref:NADAR family protein n=1 Tax=Psychromonas sp. PT13 TaxID=3439547 RepID=UPI003EBD168D
MEIRSKKELVEYVNYGNKVKYVFFWGHKKPDVGISKTCFSQWYDSPFSADGNKFITAEHYMMFHKAMLFNDVNSAEKVLRAKNPGEAKSIGREVLGFNEEIWLAKRFEIVVKANVAKFQSNAALKEFLLNTHHRVLVEASPVDKVWGIGLAEDNKSSENPNLWKGENLLGFALMETRKIIQS